MQNHVLRLYSKPNFGVVVRSILVRFQTLEGLASKFVPSRGRVKIFLFRKIKSFGEKLSFKTSLIGDKIIFSKLIEVLLSQQIRNLKKFSFCRYGLDPLSTLLPTKGVAKCNLIMLCCEPIFVKALHRIFLCLTNSFIKQLSRILSVETWNQL